MDAITSAVALQCAEKTCSNLTGWITGAAKKWGAEQRASILETYKNYILKLAARHSHTRTFFDRDKGRYIYDFYVPSSLASAGELIASPSAADMAERGRQFVVQGQGGSGKSMLMRHFLVDSILNYVKVPVFIELRTLNLENVNLAQTVSDTLAENGLHLDLESINAGLKLGVFYVLLDGFDEIAPERRSSLEKEIQKTSAKSNCIFILSSRPDSKFHSWQGWELLSMAPLSVDQACELVEKASFNADAKRVFAKKLRESLYKSHKSFLSNPLLLSIMLLTYEHDANIPTKLSVFYSRAYDALFTQHDALKGEYNRPRKTNLDITDFARVFSSFCFLTYLDRKFIFGLSYAVEKVNAASRLSSIEVEADKYIHDAKQAVCLLVEEGLDISFTHRSFQEYFAAKYISGLSDDLKKQFISRLSTMSPEDSVLDLLYEIDSDAVNSLYLIPAVEKEFDAFGGGGSSKLGAAFYEKFMKHCFDGIIFLGTDKNWALTSRGRTPVNKRAVLYAMWKWLPRPESETDFRANTYLWLKPYSTKAEDRHFKFTDSKYGKQLLRKLRESEWAYSLARVRDARVAAKEIKAQIASKGDLLKGILATAKSD